VAIDKKLRLGGMENSPPKADQSPNRFKVANNVTFTDEGYITPRPSMSGFTGNTVSTFPVERWTLFSSYKSVVDKKMYPLKLGIVDQAVFKFKHLFLNNTLVESNQGLGSVGPVFDTNYVNNFSDQSVEVNNVKYILSSPSRPDCRLIKYDGYEACTAGIGIPYFVPVVGSNFSSSSAPVEPAWSTTTGSRYVKVVNHAIDLQGNQITSNAVTYRTAGNTQGFNNLAAGVTPESRRVLVGVGESGIAYTYDGINWDANVRYNNLSTMEGNAFGAVAYGNGLFVALNNSVAVTSNPVWVSPDGVNWRRVNTTFLNSVGGGWSSVTYSGSRFVAVRFAGGASAVQRVMWSSDGISWQYATTVPAFLSWTSVAYGGTASPLFVAVNENGAVGTCVMTSPDGVTWTSRTVPTALLWNSVTWGAGPNLFVAVARNGATTTNIITSPDGITWTSRTSPAANSWRSVTFGANIITGTSYYIAVSSTAATANKIMYSTNGTTWVGVTGPNTEQHSCVAFFQVGTTTTNSTAYYVSGAFMPLPTASTKGFMYASDASVTTIAAWTQQDSPVITKLDMSASGTTVSEFLQGSGNQSYFDPGDMNPYFYGVATYSAVQNRFNLTTSSGTDSWGLSSFGGAVYVIRTIYFTQTVGVTVNSYGAIAYKFNSGGYFEGALKIFNLASGAWEDSSGDVLPIASGTFAAGRRFFTVWASPSPNGIYYYKGLVASGTFNLTSFVSKVVYTVDIRDTTIANRVQNAAFLPFSISSTLNDWYDLAVNRNPFNDTETYLNPYIALTLYQDLLLLADENVIYFSDYTNGGSLEMTPSQFIVIGETQYGRITSIVGTKDYLIVSRERKVYMVAGSITTQNIRVQEIPEVPVGAYSNSSMIEIYGTVFMMASSGAWLINAANAKKISGPISLNFKTFMMNALPQFSATEQASIGLDMNKYLTTAYEYPTSLTGYVAKYLTVVFDPFKSKVIVTNSDLVRSGQSLVFHTINGEWTTYDAYDTLATSSVTAMSMVESLMYVGTQRTSDNTARTSLEDFTSYNYDYVGRSPSKLVTTWMTQGEPSLEKLLLQVKLFGYLFGKLDIKHYANWDYNTAITSTTYTSPGNYVMFHKQRLNSSKPMAAAIELTMNSTATQAFWLEGIEVEFESIQQGMKR
jgi:hypothetical protein